MRKAPQQQRDVALNHHEKKDRIETIRADEVVKEIEMHDKKGAVSIEQKRVKRHSRPANS